MPTDTEWQQATEELNTLPNGSKISKKKHASGAFIKIQNTIYFVEKILGSGTFGKASLIIDRNNNQYVIKRIKGPNKQEEFILTKLGLLRGVNYKFVDIGLSTYEKNPTLKECNKLHISQFITTAQKLYFYDASENKIHDLCPISHPVIMLTSSFTDIEPKYLPKHAYVITRYRIFYYAYDDSTETLIAQQCQVNSYPALLELKSTLSNDNDIHALIKPTAEQLKEMDSKISSVYNKPLAVLLNNIRLDSQNTRVEQRSNKLIILSPKDLSELQKKSAFDKELQAKLQQRIDAGKYYMVMDYLGSTNLDQQISNDVADNNTSYEWALHFASQCTFAVASLHHNGVIHCDIKPDNLVISPNNILKAIDFGLARTVDATSSIYLRGIPQKGIDYFTAPEIQTKISKASDVYSVGKIIHAVSTAASLDDDSVLNQIAILMTRQQDIARPPLYLIEIFFCVLLCDNNTKNLAEELQAKNFHCNATQAHAICAVLLLLADAKSYQNFEFPIINCIMQNNSICNELAKVYANSTNIKELKQNLQTVKIELENEKKEQINLLMEQEILENIQFILLTADLEQKEDGLKKLGETYPAKDLVLHMQPVETQNKQTQARRNSDLDWLHRFDLEEQKESESSDSESEYFSDSEEKQDDAQEISLTRIAQSPSPASFDFFAQNHDFRAHRKTQSKTNIIKEVDRNYPNSMITQENILEFILGQAARHFDKFIADKYDKMQDKDIKLSLQSFMFAYDKLDSLDAYNTWYNEFEKWHNNNKANHKAYGDLENYVSIEEGKLNSLNDDDKRKIWLKEHQLDSSSIRVLARTT